MNWQINLRLQSLNREIRRARNLAEAMTIAQEWCINHTSRKDCSASIISLRTGRLKMRYWFDERLQYMEY